MSVDDTGSAGIDPGDDIPEADRLEQLTPLDPPTGDAAGSIAGDALADPVDEADHWEQQQPVSPADEDYPPDGPEGE